MQIESTKDLDVYKLADELRWRFRVTRNFPEKKNTL